jgi:hypothetical protein
VLCVLPVTVHSVRSTRYCTVASLSVQYFPSQFAQPWPCMQERVVACRVESVWPRALAACACLQAFWSVEIDADWGKYCSPHLYVGSVSTVESLECIIDLDGGGRQE